MLLRDVVRVRPFAFHFTAQENVGRIRETRRLECSRLLIEKASGRYDREGPRPQHRPINVAGQAVLLRDQAALHPANMECHSGFSLADLCEYLDSHVFFWPGTEAGPISHGWSFAERYVGEALAVLRVRTEALFGASAPLFCRFNSGAPRWSRGRLLPRTFAEGRMG